MTDARALLKIEDLAVGYGKRLVVEGITLTVRPGDMVALIGPNGSGKSTILKTITTHLAPLGGCVAIDGRDIARTPPAELATRLSVMLTDRPQTELLTCQDIVEAGRHPYTGRLGGLSGHDQERVLEAMRAAHVEQLRDCDFSCISDGQRQRVMLARAIAQDPRVIVLDEPTSFLDVRYQVEILRILRHLAKSQGVAVIMSLHEIDLAQKCADYILCVKGGRVFCAGSPEEVFTPERISELYGLGERSFNPSLGSVELGRAHGEPKTFVIAGGGFGAQTMRRLAREGTAFYAGVLHEGDIDCALAQSLAAEAVVEQAFEPIGDASFARAKELLARCEELIVCPTRFGTGNARNEELISWAEKQPHITLSPAKGENGTA